MQLMRIKHCRTDDFDHTLDSARVLQDFSRIVGRGDLDA
jgi:hypothetical protein